jgi:hypothetical protein
LIHKHLIDNALIDNALIDTASYWIENIHGRVLAFHQRVLQQYPEHKLDDIAKLNKM